MVSFNSTEDYCALSRTDMADASSTCEWPNVPPSCEETWLDYVGRTTGTIASLVYFLYFGVVFAIQVRWQAFIYIKYVVKKKGSYFGLRTGNEWLSHYVFTASLFRLLFEAGYGNEGWLNFKIAFIIQKFLASSLMCSLFTLLWGWYKIVLTPTEKKVKGARADLAHNCARILIVFLEVISAVLAVTVGLDEEYADAGVYNGTFHGVERALCWFLFTGLGFVTIQVRMREEPFNGALF